MLQRSVTLTSLLVAVGLVTNSYSVQAGAPANPLEQSSNLIAQSTPEPSGVTGNPNYPVTLNTPLVSAPPVVVPSNLEPEPPIPENLSPQTPVPTETFPTTVQPVTPDNLEFELPHSSDTPPKPLYSDEQPLRLEIKLSRRRVILYRGNTPVKTYAIAVGRPGWETPTGTFKVQQMFKNPTWVHPLQKGISIPGGDPENPLGRYWIGFWTDGKNWIGFHGTPNPKSVGTAASHGCIRMYNKDIEDLFKKVSLGVEVKVVR